MKTWNLGIVGSGLIADVHAKAIADITNANLVAVCDIDKSRADKLAETHSCKSFSSFKEMFKLDEIDIVTIATPSGLHMEPTIAAAEAGKHVICEKPIEIKLDRIDAMIDAHEKAGTKLGCIFPCRFDEIMEPIRQAIEKERFGTITYAGIYVPWWRTDEYYKDGWHGTWKLDGGGAMMNQSIHLVDTLCDLMPPVETVQAFTAANAHDIETEDTVVAVLRFANKALGIIYGTTASYPGQPKRFEISGSKGTVICVEDSITVWQFADEKSEDEDVRKRFGQIQFGGGTSDPAAIEHIGHTRNLTAFLDAMDAGADFFLDGREGRKAVQLILAIYQATKKQKSVMLKGPKASVYL